MECRTTAAAPRRRPSTCGAYRPRVEGAFARIERWQDAGERRRPLAHDLARQRHQPVRTGRTRARIADPADPARVFTLAARPELRRPRQRDLLPVQARGRRGVAAPPARRAAMVHRQPLPQAHPLRQPDALPRGDRTLPSDWCFEVVFDYGEHDLADPAARRKPTLDAAAPDPFSTLPLGLRGADLPAVPADPDVPPLPPSWAPPPTLVRSTDLALLPRRGPSRPLAAASTACSRPSPRPAGCAAGRGGYTTAAAAARTRLRAARKSTTPSASQPAQPRERAGGVGARAGSTSTARAPGMLTEDERRLVLQAQRQRLEPGRRARPLLVRAAHGPRRASRHAAALAAHRPGRRRAACARSARAADAGCFEHERTRLGALSRASADGQRSTGRAPNVRLVDLDGDGLADVLITEDEAFGWYRWQRRDGLRGGRARRQAVRRGARAGARVRRPHGRSIFLADMSGDGLADLVRDPQRRGLLLAEPRLRALRRQGRHGRRARVRLPRPLRPPPRPAGRHRRLGHGRHLLPRPDATRSGSTSRATVDRAARAAAGPALRRRRRGRRARPARHGHGVPGLALAAARGTAARRCATST